MLISEYQQKAMRTAEYPRIGENLVYPTIGLSNEAGELLGKIKKIIRDHGVVCPGVRDIPTEKEVQGIVDELGDCLWYIAAVAHELRVDLATVAGMNLEKLADRARRGVIQGSGDKR